MKAMQADPCVYVEEIPVTFAALYLEDFKVSGIGFTCISLLALI